MRKLGLSISARARWDIIELGRYIGKDSESAARRMVARIHAGAQRLTEHPLMGRSRDELMPDLRSFVVRPYILFYTVESGQILIVRVLHGARDFDAMFAEEQ